METIVRSAIPTFTFIWPMRHAFAHKTLTFKNRRAKRYVGTERSSAMPVMMEILKTTTVALPHVRYRQTTDVSMDHPHLQVNVPIMEL